MTSPQTDRQQSVLDLLQNLKGQDPLKKLFWTELNYDKVNSPLSRKGWGEQASSALADDPVLFATGGKDFHVIHARLKSDRPLLGMERPVVSRLLQDHPYALFIFSNASQDQWHFLNVKYDDDAQKRRIFPAHHGRPTGKASHRLGTDGQDRSGRCQRTSGLPNTIQKLHDEAFDVEPVTKEFFHEYGRIFEEVERQSPAFGMTGAQTPIHPAALQPPDVHRLHPEEGLAQVRRKPDYLAALWKAHLKDKTVSDKNFYRDRLKPLFFDGLNTTHEVNRMRHQPRRGFSRR